MAFSGGHRPQRRRLPMTSGDATRPDDPRRKTPIPELCPRLPEKAVGRGPPKTIDDHEVSLRTSPSTPLVGNLPNAKRVGLKRVPHKVRSRQRRRKGSTSKCPMRARRPRQEPINRPITPRRIGVHEATEGNASRKVLGSEPRFPVEMA